MIIGRPALPLGFPKLTMAYIALCPQRGQLGGVASGNVGTIRQTSTYLLVDSKEFLTKRLPRHAP